MVENEKVENLLKFRGYEMKRFFKIDITISILENK